MSSNQTFNSFQEFYPYYLSEHQNRTCRRLHVLGSLLVLAIIGSGLVNRDWMAIPLGLLVGYGFAWAGHFFFEKNRPATFQYPLYSFMGDWVMLRDVLIGRIKF